MSRTRNRLLITTDAVGGVWQYVLDLARGLDAHSYEVIVIVMGPSPSRSQLHAARKIPNLRLLDTGLSLDWLARDEDAIRLASEHLIDLARQLRPDIIHLNSPAYLAHGSFPVPVVTVLHSCVATWWRSMMGTDLPPDFAWRTELFDRGMRRAEQVVVPSASFRDLMLQQYDLPVHPLVIHNGRDQGLGSVGAGQSREEGRFAFTAGRLWDPGKNINLLDQAAAALSIPFIAAGAVRDPHGEEVSCHHLKTTGQLDDDAVADYLMQRPIFVSAAKYEPFGLAVLEAAAAGCPLILSDIPTFRELWDDAAIFIDADDRDGFAGAIEALVSEPPRRASWATLARQRAALYTPAAMAHQMAAIYRQLAPRAVA